MTDDTRTPYELRRDIPCSACGYNLRGLAPQGRCPECGQDVSVSLAELVVPDAAAAALNPRWRRQMIEAVALALVSLAAGVGGAVDWPGNWQWSRTGPDVAIVLAATWWVLQWYSALKLTRADPAAAPRRLDRWTAWALRLLASGYLVLPALRETPLTPTIGEWWPMAITFSEYCGVLAAIPYYYRVRYVYARLGRPSRAAQAALLAWLVALTISPAAVPDFRRLGEMERLLVLPSFQFGSPLVIVFVVRSMLRGSLEPTPYLPVSLAAAVMVVMLLVALLRAGRKPIKPDAAASAERSAASSSP